MTIRVHQILMRLAYGAGLCSGFLAMWPIMWFVGNVFGLPRAGDDSVFSVVVALTVIALFFALSYGGARLGVVVAQWWVRADCPKCGKAAVGVTFATVISGPYQCQTCGYVHSDPNYPSSPPIT